MTKEEILQYLPYSPPFLFVDTLDYIDEEKVTGTYTFDPAMPCYQGHFKDRPVTPGVLLIEVMAQTGLVCLGIYLLRNTIKDQLPMMVMSAADINFYIPVLPGEKVTIASEKIYFRFGKLKCRVELLNAAGNIACEGVIAGMTHNKLYA